ncbi:MAG: hypothetical protein JJE52_17735 [Acidimicrobiia bacterium]|nr:hypothetical protein [Acidimicrobiia bacterium]
MSDRSPLVDSARSFVQGHARILDQRRFGVLVDDDPVDPVVAAVLAYRNDDGGFGHALEPDTRCPDSQPLYSQIALEALASVGVHLPDAAAAALCDHLATVAGADIALPIMLSSFARYPRASHWLGVDSFPPGLNPTAAIVGLLHHMEVRHRWVEEATEWCLAALETDGPPGEAHSLGCVLTLLAHLPDRDRAERLADDAFAALDSGSVGYYRPDPADPDYGLTPLDFAASPQSPWRDRFADDVIEAHLDQLAAEQQDDGGWPIRWEPPTEPSVWEWRGMVTVDAVRTLMAYGRLDAS